MKFTINFLVLIFGLLLLTSTTYAQSPRNQLQQMIEQLQQSPNDNTLREKIIKLAPTLKPSPALPDAAIAFEGRAQFAFKSAKSENDFLAAAREYEKAVAAAPWVPGYYADLCTIYEKAGKFEDAKRHCGFYLIGLTDPAQVIDVKRRIAGLEFGIEKATNSPEKQNERLIASLNGASFVCPDTPPPPGAGNPGLRQVLTIDNGSLVFHSEYIFPNGSTKIDNPHRKMPLTGLMPTLTETMSYAENAVTIKKISDLEIVWTYKIRFTKENGSFSDWSLPIEQVCRRH